MDQIITRFPPSPTGYLHVGGARTALFNWLYARHCKGKFVFRIEDTDQVRSTTESVDAIFDALAWLGIDWDEGPYFQTQRMAIYQEHVRKLLASGHAYYCTCSSEAVEQMRRKALASGGKPKYDGTCRDGGLGPSEHAVVRFRAPLCGTTVIDDVVKGPIVFQNAEQDDFIIQRSDGTPTYNFVVVVDDMTMSINTIIRGDDHVNNTPRQIMLYQAFGAKLPVFAHVPMVLGKDKTRLSKRHGATSVTAYRDMGFLPEAMINYLVRLGWSHGDQEIFTRDELIEKFTLENIGKSAGVFDMDKLLALNQDHIKATPPERLAEMLLPFMHQKGYPAENGNFLYKVIRTLAPRVKTLVEMADAAAFYYIDEIAYQPDAAAKFLNADHLKALRLIRDELDSLDPVTEGSLEEAFHRVAGETGWKLGKIAQPVRVALTGKTASPGIFEIIEIIGKRRVMDRIARAIGWIEQQAVSG